MASSSPPRKNKRKQSADPVLGSLDVTRPPGSPSPGGAAVALTSMSKGGESTLWLSCAAALTLSLLSSQATRPTSRSSRMLTAARAPSSRRSGLSVTCVAPPRPSPLAHPPASQTAIKRTTLETSRHAVQPIQEKAWLAILGDLLPTDEELKKHNQDLSRTSIIKMVPDVIVAPPLTALSA